MLETPIPAVRFWQIFLTWKSKKRMLKVEWTEFQSDRNFSILELNRLS